MYGVNRFFVNYCQETNAWITKYKKKGSSVFIVIDIGCEKTLNGFYARNTHQGHKWRNGAKEIKVGFSSNSDGPWTGEVTKDIEKVDNISQEKTIFFPLAAEIEARYIKVTMMDYHQNRGGLQYFSENVSPDSGETYSGKLQ